MTIREAKRGSRPAFGREREAGKAARRFVLDARRAAASTGSGRFWYGIWRNLRSA